MDKNDDWLNHLSKYLIDNFANAEEIDIPTKISTDFKMQNIFNMSNVSQIRQMMNKHSMMEANANNNSQSEKDYNNNMGEDQAAN
jgi:hypothetical protein